MSGQGRFFAPFRELFFVESGRQREAEPAATGKKICEPIIFCSAKIDPLGHGEEGGGVSGLGHFLFLPPRGYFRASVGPPDLFHFQTFFE